MKKKDLAIIPDNIDIPKRSPIMKRLFNIIAVAKSDYRYIEERNFHGRFAITNRRGVEYTHSERIAEVVAAAEEEGVKPLIRLVSWAKSGMKINTESPDGATWRTVELLSAYKTPDGKLVVIEIAPPKAKED